MSEIPPTPTAETFDLAAYRRALRHGLKRFYAQHPAASLTSLMLLLSAPFNGLDDAARRLGMCQRTVESHLRFLRTAGYMCTRGTAPRVGSGRPCFVYQLTPEGEALLQP